MTAAAPHPVLAACGFLDFTCQISQSITSWFASLVESAVNPVLGIIGNDLLSTPQPGSFPAVTGMWGTSLAIADAAYVLFVLAGGILLMGYETVQVSTSAKEIAPRLFLGLAAANLSLIFISRAIDLGDGLASALAGQGADPQSAGQALSNTIRNSISTGGIFLILLALVAVILALVLAVTYVLRLMAVILLTAVAPLALACYALPQTSWAARWWWRAMTAAHGHPRRPGPGAERGGQGVLHHRLGQHRHQPVPAAHAHHDLPAVHPDAHPVLDREARADPVRALSPPPRRPVRVHRRRLVAGRAAAARRPVNRGRRGRAAPARPLCFQPSSPVVSEVNPSE